MPERKEEQLVLRLKDELIVAGQRLWQRQLLGGRDGNISVRLDGALYMITASGVSKGFMGRDDILLVDDKGRVREAAAGRQPSVESGMHIAVLQRNPAIGCVLHAHPVYATAFALSGADLNACAPEALQLNLGYVPTLPYAPAGSQELAQQTAQALQTHCAVLLARHGAVTCGENITQALLRMETLEQAAKTAYIGKRLCAQE